MQHTYQINGMSCEGCKSHVEKALLKTKDVKTVQVDLQKHEAVIEMHNHVPLEKLQESLAVGGSHYTINAPGKEHSHAMKNGHSHVKPANSAKKFNGSGIFYCPMHCEGEKTYDKAGSCPVCGMDLVEQPSLKKASQYTCPMHPEVVRDEPGACPICGMDLVPMVLEAEEEDETYKKLRTKFIWASVFTVPIFIIAMTEMIPNNPLFELMGVKYWNWVEFFLSLPVVFYATWMFFIRAWKSVVTWNLNMFTLIGMGAGVAWLFSVVALIFPGIFPDQFKTHHGTVFVYFEAATVILTLVLLGQLLEARAHGRTNSAIKELLKLAPNKATKIVDGKDQEVQIDAIIKGDLLRVKPGGKIPVDGSIQQGEAIIDESMISGEPIPVEKKKGDKVSSGTINGNRSFVMMAEKVGSETLLSKIIEMVNSASRSKAPIQNLADKISGYFVPVVLGISLLTFYGQFSDLNQHMYMLL